MRRGPDECNPVSLLQCRVGGHDFILKVAGELVRVGLHGDGFANEPGWHGIGVAIEMNGEISVDLGLSPVAAVG